MTYPLVSIFIVTYNSALFIRECLDSVLAQDYPNMEVVIGDDASTDNTVEIIHEYQQKHPHLIKLNVNSVNVGITKNCNITLALCTGKYIAMFAGDDVMLPGKISKQVRYMEVHPGCSICAHDAEIFFSHQMEGHAIYLDSHIAPARSGDFRYTLKYGFSTTGPQCMVRRDKIPIHGYDERLEIASDVLFFLEILEAGGEVHYLNEVLMRYRVHGNNLSQLKQNKMALDMLITYSILLFKYPKYASDIFYHYANALFSMAKSGDSKSIDYLKASFRIKKRFKTFVLILLYYISLGKLSFGSAAIQKLNQWVTKNRIRFNRIKEYLFHRLR